MQIIYYTSNLKIVLNENVKLFNEVRIIEKLSSDE